MQSMAHAEVNGNRRGISRGKAWRPTPVFSPGECHRQRSLASYSPWDHDESDVTELLTHTHTHTHTQVQDRAYITGRPSVADCRSGAVKGEKDSNGKGEEENFLISLPLLRTL